jgi:hypothetical protein
MRTSFVEKAAAAAERSLGMRSTKKATHSLSTLSEKLATLVPSLISVVLNPGGSDNELAATVRDIHDKERALAEKLPPSPSRSGMPSLRKLGASGKSLNSLRGSGKSAIARCATRARDLVGHHHKTEVVSTSMSSCDDLETSSPCPDTAARWRGHSTSIA